MCERRRGETMVDGVVNVAMVVRDSDAVALHASTVEMWKGRLQVTYGQSCLTALPTSARARDPAPEPPRTGTFQTYAANLTHDRASTTSLSAEPAIVIWISVRWVQRPDCRSASAGERCKTVAEERLSHDRSIVEAAQTRTTSS